MLIGIALVHAVVPFPAEFPTAAAGFVFGFAVAFPLMVLAWTMSCLAAYLLARGVGPPVLNRLAGRERMEATDRLIARGGWQILLAGRLIPVVPYNVVSYAAGATRVPIGRFTWTTAVGVMPLTALTALLGQRLQEPRFDDPVLWAVLLAGSSCCSRWHGRWAAACGRASEPAQQLLVDARVVEQLEVVGRRRGAARARARTRAAAAGRRPTRSGTAPARRRGCRPSGESLSRASVAPT